MSTDIISPQSAARVGLAQYESFMIEENLSYARETYAQQMFKLGHDLRGAIGSLTSIMEFFSANKHEDSLPLSMSVFPPVGQCMIRGI